MSKANRPVRSPRAVAADVAVKVSLGHTTAARQRTNGKSNGHAVSVPNRKGLRFTPYFTKPGVHPYDEITWEKRDASIGGEGGKVFEQKGVEVPSFWSATATNVVASKYFRGKLTSPDREWSVRQMVDRVVDRIVNEGIKGRYFATSTDAEVFRNELKYLMVHQLASFNSPVWFNIGVPGIPQQASACFILSVEDDMRSILDWFKNEGIIFKGGSGSGLNVSRLRSKREQLSGGGYASGPVSFMRGADSVAGCIKSGGTTRRAAKMVIMNADHPDVTDFIWCKAKEEEKAWALGEAGYDMSLNGEAWTSIQFQNANNSVRATDEFMKKATLEDEETPNWDLTGRVDGKPFETVNARKLLREIADAAWRCGDPGMQFDTVINDWHTSPASGRINGSNPCSEYMHIDESACNLASLNLLRFINDGGDFEPERFGKAVDLVITAQEILVGFADYPTERIGINARAHRQLGLGYANLGALLMQRGLPYDSDAGRTYAAAITALMTGEAYAQSARMAEAVGTYAAYQTPGNKAGHDRVMKKHRTAAYKIDENLVPDDLIAAARKSWDDVTKLGIKEGRGFRNAQATVLAPTGTISFMMDCDTTGVEPDIALIKYKRLVGGGMLKLVNNTVPLALARLGYSEDEVKAVTAYIDTNGTIEGAPGIKEEHLAVFDCAFKPEHGIRTIHYLGHIKMMGAVQPFISGAISKTVNLPEEATVDDVMEAYIESWQNGNKAIAIYRDGSKKVQPVSTGKEASNSKKVQIVEVPKRRKLPDERPAVTKKLNIGTTELYVIAGLYPESMKPGEIFVDVAKEGSTLSGVVNSWAVQVSVSLQYGVPLKDLVRKHMYTNFEPSGFTGDPQLGRATSIIDGVVRWLGHKFLTEEEKLEIGLVSPTHQPISTPTQTPPSNSNGNGNGNGHTSGVRSQDVGSSEKTTESSILATQPSTSNSSNPGPLRMNSTPDAPPCPNCGWLTVRNGTCYKCENCGETTGCS